MGLVEYSSSSSEEEEEEDVVPSLPEEFYNIFSNRPRIGDDPDLHEGLLRSIPHKEGMWPSHVYIEWIPSNVQREVIEKLIAEIPGESISLIRDRLATYQPLHISLSPTLMVPTELKSQLYDCLSATLTTKQCFNVTFKKELCWLPNSDNTRLFATLSLCQGNTKVSEIIQMVSSICSQIGVYQQPPPLTHGHVSIAWHKPPGPPLGLKSSSFKDNNKLYIPVNQVKLRMGNQVRSIPLAGN